MFNTLNKKTLIFIFVIIIIFMFLFYNKFSIKCYLLIIFILSLICIYYQSKKKKEHLENTYIDLDSSKSVINSIFNDNDIYINKIEVDNLEVTNNDNIKNLIRNLLFPVGIVLFWKTDPTTIIGGKWEMIESKDRYILTQGNMDNTMFPDKNGASKLSSKTFNINDTGDYNTCKLLPQHMPNIQYTKFSFGNLKDIGKKGLSSKTNSVCLYTDTTGNTKGITNTIGNNTEHNNAPPGVYIIGWKRIE